MPERMGMGREKAGARGRGGRGWRGRAAYLGGESVMQTEGSLARLQSNETTKGYRFGGGRGGSELDRRPLCFFHSPSPSPESKPSLQPFPPPLHRADGLRRRGGGGGDPGGCYPHPGGGAAEGLPGALGRRRHAGDGQDGRLERQLLQAWQRRLLPPRRQPRHLLAVGRRAAAHGEHPVPEEGAAAARCALRGFQARRELHAEQDLRSGRRRIPQSQGN